MSLYHEILEQPHVLSGLLRTRAAVEQVCESLSRQTYPYVLVAARGSSSHAALYARYLLGNFNRLPVALAAPSLFTQYRTPPNVAPALVIGISRSGATEEVVSVVHEARQQGAVTLAITNHPESALGRAAQHRIELQAGEETGGAATKTYTATLLALAMLSAGLAKDAERFTALEKVPDLAARMLEEDLRIQRMVERYRYITQCIVLGRGYNYCTAHEWALKLKELASIGAEAYSSVDFRHGPTALVENGFPVLAVVPEGPISEEMVALLRSLVLERKAELVAISAVQGALELAKGPLPLPPGIPEWISPMVCVIPSQLFMFAITRARGLNPEKPRRLSQIARAD